MGFDYSKLFTEPYSLHLSSTAGGAINNNAMMAINGYDSIRSKAMEAEGHLDNVKHTLAKKQVKFNFA